MNFPKIASLIILGWIFIGHARGEIPTWSIQLEGPIVPLGKDYHVVDLHDANPYGIGKLTGTGAKPMAYITAQYEGWRPDSKDFAKSDIGAQIYEGNNWVNPESPGIRDIMKNRIALAVQKRFYGIVFTNVGMHENDTGFETTRESTLEYINFLIQTARDGGLKVAIKGAPGLVPDLVDRVDCFVAENGVSDEYIDVYSSVTKPVFNFESQLPGDGFDPDTNVYTVLKKDWKMDHNEVVLSTNGAPLKPVKEDPENIVSWSIQYEKKIVPKNKDYHVVDLYDVSNSDLARLKAQGTLPIAYFSSQYENWRVDTKNFPKKDIGKKLDNWDGERWINPHSQPIRELMIKRIALAKKRGFYGIDVDNVDFYHFDTGFDNSKETALEYIRFFIAEAKKHDLKFSLKNANDLAYQLRHEVDFYQNEEGIEYKELHKYLGVGKPVFNIEYQKPKPGDFFPGIYSIYKSDYKMDSREVVIYPVTK